VKIADDINDIFSVIKDLLQILVLCLTAHKLARKEKKEKSKPR